MKYWIERCSQLRKKELISYPNEFPIHEVYNVVCTQEELKGGFKEPAILGFLTSLMAKPYGGAAAVIRIFR